MPSRCWTLPALSLPWSRGRSSPGCRRDSWPICGSRPPSCPHLASAFTRASSSAPIPLSIASDLDSRVLHSKSRASVTFYLFKWHCPLVDLGRSKAELVAENALLRQQLIILKRQVKRPACTKTDRILLVLLARAVRTWKQTLFLVQPETLLRWHRELFRLYWKRKSKASSHKPKVDAETVALIRKMAKENRLW